MSSLTRAPAERAQRGVAERRHVFLTEHVRLPISKGQLDESEYDGRRPGSYAMNPLRGARAAALASGVNMHVGASRRDMSFPSDLEPEWRCLGGDNGRQKWVDDRSKARPALDVRARRVGSATNCILNAAYPRGGVGYLIP